MNRSADEDAETEFTLGGAGALTKERHIVLENADLKAVNTADDPERVLPRDLPLSEKTVLGARSWNVIRYRY